MTNKVIESWQERLLAGELGDLGPKTKARKLSENIEEVSTGCWEWVPARGSKNKYGSVWIHPKPIRIHVLAATLTFGPIPLGAAVCHKCDNTLCCNPGHLFLGTQLENMRDMANKGRSIKLSGERHPLSKLSDDTMREIKTHLDSGKRVMELSRIYGVSHTIITNIKYGYRKGGNK